MKQLLALVVVVCLLGHSIVPVGITIYYHFNKTAIAQQLCVNKNNPQLHCDGKCFLKKQLKQAEEKEHQQGSKLLSEKEELIGTDKEVRAIDCQLPVVVTLSYSHASSLYKSGLIHSLLKPPLA